MNKDIRKVISSSMKHYLHERIDDLTNNEMGYLAMMIMTNPSIEYDKKELQASTNFLAGVASADDIIILKLFVSNNI